MVKLNNLSKNIVDIMNQLAKNEALARLLTHNVSNPFDSNLPAINKKNLITPDSATSKIFPVPFDPDANIVDTSFIRVYYNKGDFDSSETIQEMALFIDIVVAKSLWLINDGKRSLIRPYEIMERVIDMVGKKSVGASTKVTFDGWQHLAVNTKFDAIRLYSSYWNVESQDYINE